MIFSFSGEEAQEYGVYEAIMLHHFKFWITKNIANEKHFHDGRTWTYNSVKAFSVIFPFWTEKQIRTTIENLKNKNIIMTGLYGNSKMTRTTWYAFVDEGKWICPKRQMELPCEANGFDQEGKCYTGIKPDILPDKNTIAEDVFYECEFFSVSFSQHTAYKDAYPLVDISKELKTMYAWLISNPSRQKKSKNYARFINGWLAREQKKQAEQNTPAKPFGWDVD